MRFKKNIYTNMPALILVKKNIYINIIIVYILWFITNNVYVLHNLLLIKILTKYLNEQKNLSMDNANLLIVYFYSYFLEKNLKINLYNK